MTDPNAEAQRIYDHFRAQVLYRQFRDRMDSHERWDAARTSLGLSTEERWFVEIGETLIPEDMVTAARAAMGICVGVLGIEEPRLAWFLPETPEEEAHRLVHGPDDLEQFRQSSNVIGLALRLTNTVWVRADLSLRQVMRTTAHECRHLAQEPPADPDAYVACEQDARTFEDLFARAYDVN